MADVTISGLTNRQPSGAAIIPYTEGNTTYNATVTQVVSLASGIPSGGIILWSGSANTIPSGWVLCDGNNGTPNLVDKFILGAGATTPAVGTTGGSKDAIVVNHTHTVNDPGHNHAVAIAAGSPGLIAQVANSYYGNTNNTRPTTTSKTGITINNQGSDGTNANMPPYYALAYIMKL